MCIADKYGLNTYIIVLSGLLMAGWNSEDGVIRIGCAFLLLAPVSTAFLFICTQRSVKKRTEQVNRQSLGDYQV